MSEKEKIDHFKDIRKLISLISEFQDFVQSEAIQLPKIALLGTQSSGKSSLLKNIIGFDFLPKGKGEMTRRPLELRLVNLDARREDQPYAIFENDPFKKYRNFNEVRLNIQKLTVQIAGTGCHIVDVPIKLHIYSHNFPELTLIDLPGITPVDMIGRKDVDRIMTGVSEYYCRDLKTIILCVIPANQDLAKSDALKLARNWDREGIRTVGVITKLDQVENVESVKKMLMNEVETLKYGYVGIVNRTQEDIADQVSVELALKKEMEFFKNHPDFRDLSEGSKGTRSLISKLLELLMEAAKPFLFDVMEQIQQKLDQLHGELDEMGSPPPGSSRQKSNFLMQLICDFSYNYRNTLRAKYVVKCRSVSFQETGRGAFIKGKLRNMFVGFPRTYQCSTDYNDWFIKDTIKNHSGDQLAGFSSLECLRSLLVPQLQKLKEPIYSSLDIIHMELLELARELNSLVFSRFPNVMAMANDICSNKLAQLKQYTEVMVDTIIQGQMNTVFTNNSIYHQACEQLPSETASINEDSESLFIQEIKNRLDIYFKTVVQVLNDSIPKVIGYFLVQKSQQTIQMTLFNELNYEAIFESLCEPKQFQEKRKYIQTRIHILKKGFRALKRDAIVSRLLDDQ